MIKAVIIDDQEISRIYLYELLSKIDKEIKVIGAAADINSAFECIQDNKPDCIFLDIILSDGEGFDLLKKFDNKDFDVIFTTAHDDYAIRAIKEEAVDYLIKPIDETELKDAVNKVKQKRNKEKSYQTEDNESTKSLVFNTYKSVETVQVNKILFCCSEHYYTKICTSKNHFMISKTLKTVEQELKEYDFFRVHQSYLINLTKFKRYNKRKNLVILEDGHEIPVSRRKREELLRRVNME